MQDKNAERYILAISDDLLASAPIENAARQAGIACRVMSASSLAECSDSPQLVLLDLNATGEVETTVRQIRDQLAGTPVVAFGPHVHAAKLKAATKAGCDQVLTLGQFHQQVVPLVASYSAS